MKNSGIEIKRDYTIEDLEELLDKIPYEVYIKNMDGKYKYVNKASTDRIGLKKEDIIGKNDYDIRSYQMAKICIDGDKTVLKSGDKAFIENKIIEGNVETSYEIFKALLHNNKEIKIGGVAKFVTEDKSLCRSIMESSNTIMNKPKELDNSIIYNEILNDLKNTIKCNDVALYLYNKEKNTMCLNKHIGKYKEKFFEEYIITDNDKPLYYNNYQCEIKEVLSDGSNKYIYLLKNNNMLLGCIHIYYKEEALRIKKEFIRYICILLAFTEANRILTNDLNKELKCKNQVQKKLQMMIDNTIDVYAILQIVDGKLVWLEISKRCSEIIGWTIEDLNTKKYIEFIHQKDKTRIKSIMEMNKNVTSEPFTMQCKNGKWITIDAEINSLTEKIYMITAKDITNLIELKKDKEELEQAVELECLKTEFFANVSHEFKTPLNIILSTVQLIMNYVKINNEYPKPEKLNKYLNSIKQNSYRLLKLSNNMIDITKIDGDFYHIDMRNYNVVEIVENIVQSVVVYMKNNKRNIIFDTMEEEVITACDPDQIERIILNLLSNAMKFTVPEGNIYVNMEVNELCNKVIIRIANDGQPINTEDSTKIFERFTQSESLLTRSIEGSGIGLSLVKELVELHKGIVYVNTYVKEGTEFCIELPIRKMKNYKYTNVREKSIVSRVEKFDIEFSDIYN